MKDEMGNENSSVGSGNTDCKFVIWEAKMADSKSTAKYEWSFWTLLQLSAPRIHKNKLGRDMSKGHPYR